LRRRLVHLGGDLCVALILDLLLDGLDAGLHDRVQEGGFAALAGQLGVDEVRQRS
jgi:hypothetical protein